MKTDSFYPRPQIFNPAPLKSKLSPKCGRCEHVWTPEELAGDGINRHMVEEHGYKRVGGQVFQSYPCVACGKPGLYKVGRKSYCKEHIHLATARRVEIGLKIDRNERGRDQERAKHDTHTLSRKALHEAKKGH